MHIPDTLIAIRYTLRRVGRKKIAFKGENSSNPR